MQVSLYRLGCWKSPTHGRDPTTARHGNFWLLGFPPGPFRSSLDNLDLPDSSNRSMSTPSLVRTPVQRKRLPSRSPNLKPSTTSSLPEAGLQVRATYPAKRLSFWFLLFASSSFTCLALLCSLVPSIYWDSAVSFKL